MQIADNLHPVANPAVDAEGNIYVTYSGQRGQKVPVSLYKVTANYQVKPFVTEMMNPTGLALDPAGMLYVSCRNDGTIHRVTPDGRSQLWVEGMGIATGLAFDAEHNLFVGDRSGTIFKISPDRQIFVFATLEPSIAAYHLAFSPDGRTLCLRSHDFQLRSHLPHQSPGRGEPLLSRAGPAAGHGLRPRGQSLRGRLAKAAAAASCASRPDGAEAEVVLSGSGLVGLALAAHAPRRADHHQRAFQPRLGRRRPAPAALIAAMMKAEIIAVGSELLTPDRMDTNSLFLTRRLNHLGIAVTRKTVVGDEHEQLRDAFRESLSTAPSWSSLPAGSAPRWTI